MYTALLNTRFKGDSVRKKPDYGENTWLTSSNVASYCQVSKNTVLTWIRSGELKAFRLPSGHYRIRKEDFKGFLEHFNMPINDQFFGKKSTGKEGM